MYILASVAVKGQLWEPPFATWRGGAVLRASASEQRLSVTSHLASLRFYFYNH